MISQVPLLQPPHDDRTRNSKFGANLTREARATTTFLGAWPYVHFLAVRQDPVLRSAVRNRGADLPGHLLRLRGAADHEVDVLGGSGHHRPRRPDRAGNHQHGYAVCGQDTGTRTERCAGTGAGHRHPRDGDADQRAAAGEDRSPDLGTRYRPVRQPGPGDRLAHPAADDHQPQTGRSRGSDHEPVPNRLGAKRFCEWPDAGDLHHRRGQQDLRPHGSGRTADGDPADPQGQQHRPQQHDRSALESGGPPTGAGRGAACRGRRRLLPRRPPPAAAPSGASYPAAPAEPSTAQRLQELETLRATGAISDDEYAAKRQQILADL